MTALIQWHPAIDHHPCPVSKRRRMPHFGGGDAVQGCGAVARYTPRTSKRPSQCVLLLDWTMQLVKGILESTVHVGKTLLIWPPVAELAAGHAADELYPRPWALRSLVGTSHSFPVQDLPQCCTIQRFFQHQVSRAPAASAEGLRWRGREVRQSPGCPADPSSLPGCLHDVMTAQNELTTAGTVAAHSSSRTCPCSGHCCPGGSPVRRAAAWAAGAWFWHDAPPASASLRPSAPRPSRAMLRPPWGWDTDSVPSQTGIRVTLCPQMNPFLPPCLSFPFCSQAVTYLATLQI